MTDTYGHPILFDDDKLRKSLIIKEVLKPVGEAVVWRTNRPEEFEIRLKDGEDVAMCGNRYVHLMDPPVQVVRRACDIYACIYVCMYVAMCGNRYVHLMDPPVQVVRRACDMYACIYVCMYVAMCGNRNVATSSGPSCTGS
jgi:hypothetical protein